MLILCFAAASAADDFVAQRPRADAWRRIGPQNLILADSAWQSGSGPLLGVECAIVDRRRETVLPAPDIDRALAEHGAAALSDWAAPFRLAWKRPDGAVCVAADHSGLGHWFLWQGAGVAVASSSAALVGQMFGLGVDVAALAGLALTGSLLGEASAVAGVRKLAAGRIAVLRDGKLSFERQADASLLSEPEMALQAAVRRLLHAYPDTRLELSGGWDSRLLTALAVSGSERGAFARPREGMTIGRDANPDVVVARKVASFSRLDHLILSPCANHEDPDHIFSLIERAAAGDDYASNPLDRAILNEINASRPRIARLNGQNGEFLRGFYYPGQPLDAAPSRALARRLISWRLICNDRVDPALFDPAWFAAASRQVEGALEGMLVDHDASDWAATLDAFYVERRMQRWFGTAASASLALRPILSPFFDADVLAMGRRTAPREKANCRFVANQISNLSRGLAALELDNGCTPAAVARGGWTTRASEAHRFAKKASARAWQKIRGSDRSTGGSGAILPMVEQHRLLARIDSRAMMSTGMFAAGRLEEICSGRVPCSRATAGFLMNSNFLAKRLAQGRA